MRRLSLFLAVLLTLLAGMAWGQVTPIQAQSSGPTVLVVPDFSWDRDQGVVRVPLTVAGPTGAVLDFEFDLIVDTSKFLPVSLTSDGTITYGGLWTISMRRTAQNVFHIEGFSGQGLTGRNGPLLYVVFQRTVATGGSTSSLQVQNLIWNEGSPASRVDRQGSITILPIRITGGFKYGDTGRPISGGIAKYQTVNLTQIGQVTSVSDGSFVIETSERAQYRVDYSKQPYSDLRNGLSPLDAARAHQCSMDYRTDCDPVVADVSRNGKITSHDAALMARWLLTHTQSPDSFVGYWYCVPPSLTFNLQFDYQIASTQCLLVGDVTKNWSAAPDTREATTSVGVSLPERVTTHPGVTTTLPITLTGNQMEAVLLRFETETQVVGFGTPEGWSVTPQGEGFMLLGDGPADQIVFDLQFLAQTSGDLTITEVWGNENESQSMDESVQIEVILYNLFLPSLQRQVQ